MERWDDGDRVRPVPIGDDAAPFAGDGPSTPDDGPRPPRRPWLPLAIAASAVVIVVASVTMLGSLQFEDEEPRTDFSPIDEAAEEFTPTTTIPPRLDEVLPDTTDRLTVIAERDDELWALLWDPSFREPNAISLGLPSSEANRFSRATFDRSGRYVAVDQCASGRCALFVGEPTELGSAQIPNQAGFQWHATEVGRLAWIVPDDGSFIVFTGTVNPLSRQIEDVEAAFTLDRQAAIVQWDSDGFVVTRRVQSAARGPTGEVVWEIPGAALSATTSVVAVLDDDGWFLVDRMSGEPIADAPIESEVRSATFVTTSESTDLIAQVTLREDAPSSLRVIRRNHRVPRIIQVDRGYQPVGFTDDAALVLFVGERGSRLQGSIAFVDWSSGATREISAPDGYQVLGLDLG